MSKFNTLINILDQLRKDAPTTYSSYYPLETDVEKLNQARSKAYLHLFLKVRFGILNFEDRENYITDGNHDGGIDAYYIDSESKKIVFIQSKFRINDKNFIEKEITLQELLKMDVDRIVDGETTYEDGVQYNSKILKIQSQMQKIADIGRYAYEVTIIANITQSLKASDLQKLSGGFPVEVINYEKAFTELVFPVVSGTYYNEKELCITLNVTNTNSAASRVDYNVTTQFKECDISLVFVPTIEIGKILYKYKNSILKYNPRSYLELANNDVNQKIAETIKDKTTNEFALFNNGITMLSEGTHFNEKVGKKGEAQVIVTSPQIINGGQTAYTLSRLYQSIVENNANIKMFNNKEVLLKIITFNIAPEDDAGIRLRLIEEISKATNSQTPVDEADRRSNEKIQIELQKIIFDEFGFYYERKRGEFADGLRQGYISRAQLIDREIFLRICIACDFRPSYARRNSLGNIFREDRFSEILNSTGRCKEYFFAYTCYVELLKIEKSFASASNNKHGIINFGQALRFGKYSVISVCNAISSSKDIDSIGTVINGVLEKWLKFEEFVKNAQHNREYFTQYVDDKGTISYDSNFDGYYKGRTLDSDLKSFFGVKEPK